MAGRRVIALRSSKPSLACVRPSVPGNPTRFLDVSSRMDKKWTNRPLRRFTVLAKLLLELVELMGIEPMTA